MVSLLSCFLIFSSGKPLFIVLSSTSPSNPSWIPSLICTPYFSIQLNLECSSLHSLDTVSFSTCFLYSEIFISFSGFSLHLYTDAIAYLSTPKGSLVKSWLSSCDAHQELWLLQINFQIHKNVLCLSWHLPTQKDVDQLPQISISVVKLPHWQVSK